MAHKRKRKGKKRKSSTREKKRRDGENLRELKEELAAAMAADARPNTISGDELTRTAKLLQRRPASPVPDDEDDATRAQKRQKFINIYNKWPTNEDLENFDPDDEDPLDSSTT